MRYVSARKVHDKADDKYPGMVTALAAMGHVTTLEGLEDGMSSEYSLWYLPAFWW